MADDYERLVEKTELNHVEVPRPSIGLIPSEERKSK